MGLGLVKDRLGRTAEGLELLLEALAFYKTRFSGVEHSLVAKTLTSIGHCHIKLNQIQKAEEAFKEAVRIFKFTCGDNTPLTANALHCTAQALAKHDDLAKHNEARLLLLEALTLYVNFDSLGVYVSTIIEILNEAKTWCMKASEQEKKIRDEEQGKESKVPKSLERLNARFEPFLAPILTCRDQMAEQQIPRDGNAAVFFKVAAEISMLAGDYTVAQPFLTDAIELFEQVTEVDCRNLIRECQGLLSFTGNTTHHKPNK